MCTLLTLTLTLTQTLTLTHFPHILLQERRIGELSAQLQVRLTLTRTLRQTDNLGLDPHTYSVRPFSDDGSARWLTLTLSLSGLRVRVNPQTPFVKQTDPSFSRRGEDGPGISTKAHPRTQRRRTAGRLPQESTS